MSLNLKKKYLGLCVARKNSKGLKNKNIIKIKSKPCSYWTLLSAKKSKCLTDIVLSTDSKKIIKIAKKLKIKTPYLRPKFLSEDNSPIYKVIHHLINYYKKKKIYYDYIVLLQCSSPFRTNNHIDEAIKYFEKNKKKKISSLISVVKSDIKTNWLLKKKGKNIFPVFKNNSQDSRRQNNNDYFLPNGAIYIADIKNFKKNFFSSNTLFYEMDRKSSIDIDTKEDVDFIKRNYE